VYGVRGACIRRGREGGPGARGSAINLLKTYNWGVARGWESKSIEAQIESANLRRGEVKPRLTLEQVDLQRKLDSLLLHRTRVLSDLEKCSEERYRRTLADGLAYLEQQLTALGWQR
jgi:hypothetical protein